MAKYTSKNTTDDIDSWYRQSIGKKVARLEQEQLSLQIRSLMGQYILQLGTAFPLSKNSRYYPALAVVVKEARVRHPSSYHLLSKYTELPFPSASFNTVILPHLLELSSEPASLIKEAWRMVTPEGHLIVLGFNPMGLQNLSLLFNKCRLNLPASAKFYSAYKILGWLEEADYEIVANRSFAYCPLMINTSTSAKWRLAEKWLGRLLPHCGSLYLLMLKKRVIPLTPIAPRSSWRELFTNKPFAAPAAEHTTHE